MMTPYQEFIFRSRYSRWLGNRREDWSETVNRYLDFMTGSYLRSELYDVIYNLDVMPSMRAMWTAGPALERCNVAGYNCSYLQVNNLRAFDELMYILMCGTGVGYSVERQVINELPTVAPSFDKSSQEIVVGDSKAGWARAYRKLISILYSGGIPRWNMAYVRPAGSPLKTFGGRSSGPEPLEELFDFTTRVITGAMGRKLTSIEVHDLCCKVADIVVVGGVRRSAMISLSNLSDDRMRHAKSGQWWESTPYRALANNSAVYTERPDMGTFIREWESLYESKSGERGIFNRDASRHQATRSGRRADCDSFGTNPCCVSGDTAILTSKGYQSIESRVGKTTTIWNGESWEEVIPYEAGVASLYRVTLSDGTYLDCTSNHRWCIDSSFVTTENLLVGMKLDKFGMPVIDSDLVAPTSPYSQGFYSGDGNRGYNFSWVYTPKYSCLPALVGEIKDSIKGRKVWKHGPMLDKSWVPFGLSKEYRLAWLAGLLDADGTVTKDKNGSGFQIVSIDYDFLSRVRLMLTTLGVRAKVVSASIGGWSLMPDGRGGYANYKCKETWRLLINNFDAWHLMNMGLPILRLKHNGQKPQRDARQFVKIVNIEDLDIKEMTYCYTEPKTSRGTFNGIVTGNSEIILRPNQFCNLSEVVVREYDTRGSISDKVRLATILGTYQARLTNFKYLRKTWKTITEDEALLGVSLTGIYDNPDLVFNPQYLTHWKSVAIKENESLAKKIGIKPSAAITCIKPSGTVSQLVDSASGCHPRYSDYYIRTVRGDNKDPLTTFLKEEGIPYEPAIGKEETTTVFSFYVKAPEGSVKRSDRTAVEHLKDWKFLQDYWCEHKPSCTINVKEDEWLDVGAWVYKNFDSISGVSFLPYDTGSYKQAPYQSITKEEYEKNYKDLTLDWSKLDLYEDTTRGASTMACSGDGVCELVDI